MHPCLNHDNVHAAVQSDGLSAFGVKEHTVQNLASSLQPVLPLQFPARIGKPFRAETVFCAFTLTPSQNCLLMVQFGIRGQSSLGIRMLLLELLHNFLDGSIQYVLFQRFSADRLGQTR